MAQLDELLHLVQHDGVSEMQIRAGRIDSELDRQAALLCDPLFEFGGGLDVVATIDEHRNLLRGFQRCSHWTPRCSRPHDAWPPASGDERLMPARRS